MILIHLLLHFGSADTVRYSNAIILLGGLMRVISPVESQIQFVTTQAYYHLGEKCGRPCTAAAFISAFSVATMSGPLPLLVTAQQLRLMGCWRKR
jgi:hypothetical protein